MLSYRPFDLIAYIFEGTPPAMDNMSGNQDRWWRICKQEACDHMQIQLC